MQSWKQYSQAVYQVPKRTQVPNATKYKKQLEIYLKINNISSLKDPQRTVRNKNCKKAYTIRIVKRTKEQSIYWKESWKSYKIVLKRWENEIVSKKIYGEMKINKKKIKRLRFDWAKIVKKKFRKP